MNMAGFKWVSATCLVWVLVSDGAQGQAPQIALDANSVGPVLVIPEDTMDFAIQGPDGSPFALLVSVQAWNLATPSGTLVPDPRHLDANIVFDGFSASHPLTTTSYLNVNGLFTTAFVPFPNVLATYASAYYVQGLTLSPTTSTGVALSNALTVQVSTPPPQVALVTPNVVQCSGQVTVIGTQFPIVSNQLMADLDGIPLSVSCTSPGNLTLSTPSNGRSGPLRVTSSAGSSDANPDSLASWIAVMPGAIYTPATAPSPITFPCAIRGIHNRYAPTRFAVQLEAGQEVFAELYVYDPVNERITGESNPSVPFYDPVIKLLRNPTQPVVVVCDDDSGPAVSACIGTPGAPRYVAVESETVLLQVDSWNGNSGGEYLLIVGVRTGSNVPLTISSVHPNRARCGDVVTVFGSGFSAKSLAATTVTVGGMPCQVESVNLNSVRFVVNDGVSSGPVVVTHQGIPVHGALDDVETFLAITSYVEATLVESTVAETLIPGTTYRGSMDFIADLDDFELSMTQGQVLTFEIYAYDPAGDRIIDTSFLAQGPADMEFRIYNPAIPYAPLLTQMNDGPGFNAIIGPGQIVSGFTAPYTGMYRVRVSTFFGWSVGPYLATARLR